MVISEVLGVGRYPGKGHEKIWGRDRNVLHVIKSMHYMSISICQNYIARICAFQSILSLPQKKRNRRKVMRLVELGEVGVSFNNNIEKAEH